MGQLVVLPASGGEPISFGERGVVRAFPRANMAERDGRMFDRIVSVAAVGRSPIGIELRIRASDDIDPRWLDDLEVAVHARHVGQKTGSVTQRFDRDLDPADIRLQVILGNPNGALRAFVPDAVEHVALVSRGVASRVFRLTDLQP